jgi:hypothetical protein
MLDLKEQRRLINQDLYNELRYLLISATVWQRCRDIELSGDHHPFAELPHHLQAIAMDSACVHARALYEFFFNCKQDAETAHAERDFGVALNPTKLFRDYEHALNKRLFHIDLDRPHPHVRNKPVAVKRNVNRKPYLFAADVLKIWDRFARQVPQLQRELSAKRALAISEAAIAAGSVQGRVIFS